MKKANAKVESARQYVASYKSKPTPKPQPKVEPVKVQAKPMVKRFDSAEIKKLEKGHFFVVLTIGCQKQEVNKRFKSVPKAQDWISRHQFTE